MSALNKILQWLLEHVGEDYIVEQGSNENGSYVKWASGRMEQWMSTVRTDIAFAQYGNSSLYMVTYIWTLPVPFVGTVDDISPWCGAFKWGTSGSWGGINNVYNTNIILKGIDVVARAAGTATRITAGAIGRWK